MQDKPIAVRVLPMNLKKEFKDYKDVHELQARYFSDVLPKEEGGWYYYRVRGLDAEPGTVVLFQCKGKIVASARLEERDPFPKPWHGFRGRLRFAPFTIRTFEPVGASEFRKVWPDSKGFGRGMLRLDPARYPTWERRHALLSPVTHAGQILRAAAKAAGPGANGTFSREDVRIHAGIPRERWSASYDPIFQGMRTDQAGRAPDVAEKFKHVFRQVSHGVHKFTEYGKRLADGADPSDGPPAKLGKARKDLEEEGYFSPGKLKDERERRVREVVQRRGQQGFRRRLLAAYGQECAVTRCDALAALEAAHILPYIGKESDKVPNGLLLRADIHSLFDLNLIGIRPGKLTLELAPSLRGTTYAKLQGKRIHVPRKKSQRPHPDALRKRWEEFEAQAEEEPT